MAQGHKCVTVSATSCRLDPYSRLLNIYLIFYFHFFALMWRQSAALSSVTQHAMRSEFSGKWGTECLNTRFPLPTLLSGGYSEADWKMQKIKKMKKWFINLYISFQYMKFEVYIENLSLNLDRIQDRQLVS